MKEQLKQLLNKPCWFKEGTLEIRKTSDGKLIEVADDYIIVENAILEKVQKIPINQIFSINRKDLETIKIITYEDEEYEKKIMNITNHITQRNFNAAITAGKSLFGQCDPSDYISTLWAVGPIVAGYISLMDKDNSTAEPNTTNYLELKKYLGILMKSYYNVPNEMRQHYQASDINFNKYSLFLDLFSKNQSLMRAHAGSNKKPGCFGMLLFLIIIAGGIVFFLV